MFREKRGRGGGRGGGQGKGKLALSVGLLRVGLRRPTSAVQMQWLANLINYVYFTVMIYHAPYTHTPELIQPDVLQPVTTSSTAAQHS
jgi:hypothetical protein